MAASSVAAVNTSKEATLIRLLRFPAPPSGLVDSFDPPQSRGRLPQATVHRLCFAGHMLNPESPDRNLWRRIRASRRRTSCAQDARGSRAERLGATGLISAFP